MEMAFIDIFVLHFLSLSLSFLSFSFFLSHYLSPVTCSKKAMKNGPSKLSRLSLSLSLFLLSLLITLASLILSLSLSQVHLSDRVSDEKMGRKKKEKRDRRHFLFVDLLDFNIHFCAVLKLERNPFYSKVGNFRVCF